MLITNLKRTWGSATLAKTLGALVFCSPIFAHADIVAGGPIPPAPVASPSERVVQIPNSQESVADVEARTPLPVDSKTGGAPTEKEYLAPTEPPTEKNQVVGKVVGTLVGVVLLLLLL